MVDEWLIQDEVDPIMVNEWQINDQDELDQAIMREEDYEQENGAKGTKHRSKVLEEMRICNLRKKIAKGIKYEKVAGTIPIGVNYRHEVSLMENNKKRANRRRQVIQNMCGEKRSVINANVNMPGFTSDDNIFNEADNVTHPGPYYGTEESSRKHQARIIAKTWWINL